ncbi:beta-glucuronidase [Acidaminobacter sp. JC074]|uniref:beta-glucuronidase n=1 Tax=Acidaminobacter sp. JC074 TaxID=2530199 RepID=UPI001F0D6BB3|nr:beta-glucuronidase [Acidaminobacter sp. JC074]MCH4890132.1 beta-glucuronidase [Acidaminobacter sp. JC074]
MLYPQRNKTREIIELDGIWNFKLDDGQENRLYENPLTDTMMMPVPASYNDIYDDPKIHHHIGGAWYERSVYLPESWSDKRIVLRFGAVTHHAKVWINGQLALEHSGGYTPFEADVSNFLDKDYNNRITVWVDNRLDFTSVPMGKMFQVTEDIKWLKYYFDFYNYAGINRPVVMYCTDQLFIEDVNITTEVEKNNGYVDYVIDTKASDVRLLVKDMEGKLVAKGSGLKGRLSIENVKLWQPLNAYLYTCVVEVYHEEQLIDAYEESFGVRSVEVLNDQFLINGKPFYFKGFGKHEDSDIVGRGYNEALNIRDFSLLKWIGANSFRTSHYPYAEEILKMADREGIVVIGESPAVGLNMNLFQTKDETFDYINLKPIKYPSVWEVAECQDNHIKVMEEMIKRDKNHPSIVMWCVANEPASDDKGAYEYFKPIVNFTRSLDPSRPITIVEYNGALPMTSEVTKLVDVVCLNRYYGWYLATGKLDLAEILLSKELDGWYQMHKKPIIITEYGVDTLHGNTDTIAKLWTEEFQEAYLNLYHKVFDSKKFLIGEHVWNFADFATAEGITRVDGNKKGIFTRNRKPKKAAYLLKDRWHKIDSFYYK